MDVESEWLLGVIPAVGEKTVQRLEGFFPCWGFQWESFCLTLCHWVQKVSCYQIHDVHIASRPLDGKQANSLQSTWTEMKFCVLVLKASGEYLVFVDLCLDCLGKGVTGLTLDLGSTTTQTHQHVRVSKMQETVFPLFSPVYWPLWNSEAVLVQLLSSYMLALTVPKY